MRLKRLIVSLSALCLLLALPLAAADLQRPQPVDPRAPKTVQKPLPAYTVQKVKMKRFVIPALLAWQEGRKNGFRFYPQGASGSRNGSEVWGSSYYRDESNRLQQEPNTALLTGGVSLQAMKLYTGVLPDVFSASNFVSSYALFHFFEGKKLAQHWTISHIEFSGNYRFHKRVNADSRDPHVVVKLQVKPNDNSSMNARFDNLVLVGPENRDWREAFSGAR